MDFQPIVANVVPCWHCDRPNPKTVLAGVRFAKCKCGAMFPGHSNNQFEQESRAIGLPLRERVVLAA